jgi:hypothetical protein
VLGGCNYHTLAAPSSLQMLNHPIDPQGFF